MCQLSADFLLLVSPRWPDTNPTFTVLLMAPNQSLALSDAPESLALSALLYVCFPSLRHRRFSASTLDFPFTDVLLQVSALKQTKRCLFMPPAWTEAFCLWFCSVLLLTWVHVEFLLLPYNMFSRCQQETPGFSVQFPQRSHIIPIFRSLLFILDSTWSSLCTIIDLKSQ